MFRRTTLIAPAAAALIVGALALTGCSAAAPGGTPAGGGPDDTSPEVVAPEVAGLNTPVSVGSFEFTATGVTDAGATVGTSPLTQTAQGTFIRVDLTVKNVGDSSATFLSNYVKLVDDAGKTYDADSVATLYASPDDNAWVAAINPGNSIQGPILFDVPAGTTAASIQVSDSAFSTGETINLS
jgi:hypothetical protein